MAERTIKVQILGDVSGLSKSFGRAGGEAQGFANRLGKIGGAIGRFAKVSAFAAGAAGIGGLAIAMKRGFDEAAESAKVMAQTNAVLKSTQGVANMSAREIEGLASQLSELTGVDDENIQAGENWLLTFKNIRDEAGKGNDIFTQTTKVTLDLAAAQAAAKGTTIDMASASTIMGKALNDPIKGISALTRVGVTFTQAQKDHIAALMKSGELLEAQKIILGEVKSQVEGSAKAYGDTFPGQIAKLKNSFDELAGQMFGALVPALRSGVEQLSGFLQKLGEADGAGAKLRVVVDGLKNLSGDIFNALKRGVEQINWNAVWAGVKVNAQALTNKINEGLRTANWSAVGHTLGTSVVAAVNFTADLSKKLTDELAQAAHNVDWTTVGKAFVDGLSGSGGVSDRVKTVLGNIWKIDKATWFGPSFRTGEAVRKAIAQGITAGSMKSQIAAKFQADLVAGMNAAKQGSLPTASTIGAALGDAIATGSAAGVASLAPMLITALNAQIAAAMSGTKSRWGIHSPSTVWADEVGKPMGEGVVSGFVAGIFSGIPRMAAALKAAAERVGQANRDFVASFRSLAQQALSAFDDEVSKWTPPALGILSDLQGARQDASLTDALQQARDAAEAAGAAWTGALRQEGESDEEFAARKEQLHRDFLAALKAVTEAETNIIEANLQKQADIEQKAHDSRMATQREHLAAELLQVQEFVMKHPEKYREAQQRILAVLKKYHVPMHEAGRALASKFAEGLEAGLVEVYQKIRALADALETITGPVGGSSGVSGVGNAGPSRPPDVGRSSAAGGRGTTYQTYHINVRAETDDASRLARKIRDELDKIGLDNAVAPVGAF